MVDPGKSSLPPPPGASLAQSPAPGGHVWAPYVTTMVVLIVIAILFVVDGTTPVDQGPDRDRHGQFTAAGLIELEAGTVYGIYDRTGNAGPRNPRVDLDGDPIPTTTASRSHEGRREVAVRFMTTTAGVYRIRVDAQSLPGAPDAVRFAWFSIGDDPLLRRDATEPWPFVGAALALVGALFVWGLGWDHTRSG